MTTHHFKVGDVVNVITRTFSGKFVLEGKATIHRLVDNSDDYYRVRFHDTNGKPQRKTYYRFADPEAQADTVAWLETLNRSIRP